MTTCTTEVRWLDHSPSVGHPVYPSVGSSGIHSDGYASFSEPGGLAGDLFVIHIISSKTDITMPVGYTEIMHEVWGNADGDDHPTYTSDLLAMLGYRILNADQAIIETVDPGGTWTGLSYNSDGGPGAFVVGQDISTTVHRYDCVEMSGDIYDKIPFPVPPIEIGGFASTDYLLLDDESLHEGFQAYNEVTIPTVTADWVGNHIHAIVTGGWAGDFLLVDGVERVNLPATYVDPRPSDFSPNLWGNIGNYFDEWNAGVRVTGKDYFTGVRQFATTWIPGAFRAYSHTVYSEAFDPRFDPPNDYAVVPSVFAWSYVVQAPESHPPFVDNCEDVAYWGILASPITG